MVYKQICFEFLENPSFRTAFEFAPSYRIVQMVAYSSIIPFPLTPIGTLLAALVELENKNIDFRSLDDVVINFDPGFVSSRDPNCIHVKFSSYEEILDALGLKIRRFYGPYLEANKKVDNQQGSTNHNPKRFVPVSVTSINDALIPVDSNNDEYYIDIGKTPIFPLKEAVTGIELDSSKKVVRPGYLYTLEKVPLRNLRLCIDVDILDGKEVLENTLNSSGKIIVKLGTKGAKALIKLGDNTLFEVVDNTVDKFDQFLVISPAILIPDYFRELKTFRILEGNIIYTSIGYSLAKNSKRPIMPMLITGSKIEMKCPDTHIGALKKYGFGSLIPVKMEE